jgi:phenylacetate-CoA ligase
MSPFYRRRFDEAKVKPEDIKTFDDFRKRIPVFRKDDIRAEMERTGDLFWGNRTVPLENLVHIGPSTGTTGTPTPLIATGEDLELAAENNARNVWMGGLRPTMRALFPLPFWHWYVPTFYAGVKKISHAPIIHTVPTFPMFTQGLMEALERVKPDWAIIVLDTVLDINERCRAKGVTPKELFPSLKYLYSGLGEPMTPHVTKHIIDLWGVEDCFDSGGIGEPLLNVTDCFAHQGQHLWTDYIYIEVIDPDTNELLQPGEGGELTYTSFCKGNPMVRFATEDYGDIIEEPCLCGRTHPRAKIYTRTGWRTKVAGKTVEPYTLRLIFEEFPETTEGSFSIMREKEMEVLKLQVVYDARITKDPEELKQRITKSIKEKIGVDAEITWVTWEELPKILHKIRRIVDV